MPCVYLRCNLPRSQRFIQTRFLGSFSSHLQGFFFCTCTHIFNARALHGWRGAVGNLLYRPVGWSRSRPQVAVALARSFCLLALKGYFYHSGIIIFLLLPDIHFSAVPRSNNKRAEKIIPHVDSGCFVSGRGRAACFPRPQHSPRKCSPPYGKGEAQTNEKLL